MTSTPAEHARSRGAWAALRAILAIEAIGGAVLLVLVVRGFFGAADEAIGPRVSLLLAVLAWWAWIAITFVGALRGRHSWVRGSALTNHVLIFAAATGLLQGILGPQVPLGLALLALALGGFLAAILARPDYAESPEAAE